MSQKRNSQRRQRKVDKNKNSAPKLAIFLLLAFGIWLGFRSHRSPPVPASKISAPKAIALKQEILESTPETKTAEIPEAKRREQLNRDRQSFNNLILTGLKEIPLVNREKDLKLSLRTKAEAQRCRTGDFDLLKSLVDDASKKVFLLSIEALLPAQNQLGQSFRLSLRDILDGKNLEYILPKSKEAKDYGIYLCLDASKSKECSSKRVLSGSQWDAAVADGKSADKILYFQSFTVRGDKAFLIPSDQWGDSEIAKLKPKLKASMENSEKSLDILASMMKKLGSLGAIPEDRSLSIPLPYRHPECGNKTL